ncbi:MAG: beta-propeller fold lactonase family protein [Cytophagaceae bacterium]|nr:beta-propeller fold lactonase family protein [Cytophagaceae bacterium]
MKKETREIGLVKVLRDGPTGNIIRLELVGNTIKMEGNLKAGEFTKDGKYFLVLDSRDEPGTNSLGQKGQVFVVRFSLEDNGTHALISKAEVEENPSAMVIHPSGKFILVTNQKKSFEYPVSKNTGKGSLSVLLLQPEGTLQNKINVPLDGVMPSGVVFDKNGNNLAVSFMQFLNFGKSTGGIQFFNFTGGNNPKVEKQSSMINTSKGIHSLRVIEDF